MTRPLTSHSFAAHQRIAVLGIIAAFLLACAGGTQDAPPAAPAAAAPSAPAVSPEQAGSGPAVAGAPATDVGPSAATAWKPADACAFLAGVDGLQTGTYKVAAGDAYFCVSGYKEIGEAAPLANNIVYQVKGSATSARELSLDLNVNAKGSAKGAHAALVDYSRQLVRAALAADLEPGIQAAIAAGKVGAWEHDGATLQVTRDDWPTGKGYEVHFIVRVSK